ncbi:MAG: HAMP domain-containing sensor histidine kinase [Acidobacteriota bacterium]
MDDPGGTVTGTGVSRSGTPHGMWPGGTPHCASEQEVREAILRRPALSIRMRVTLVFSFLTLLITVITVAAVVFISSFERRTDFLEGVGNFAFEIQQARRFEKNFFLYGTDLAEALSNTELARRHLQRYADPIADVIGEQQLIEMGKDLDGYEALLEELLQRRENLEPGERELLEARLRTHGAKILDDAQRTMNRERLAMREMLDTFRYGAIGFLVFMLAVMAAVAVVVTQSVIQPLGRFVNYAARIGAGDFTPIEPARRYRDEFSDLAIAINRMICEISSRHDQLLQQGKMVAVGSLTSGVAHELNNPLNNIGLTVEALIDGWDEYGDDAKRRMLDQVDTQVERASGTIRNLLDFTRKDQPLFTKVNLADAVATTLRLVANELELADVEAQVDLPADLPPVRGNPRSLQQVFLNLFLNSIGAMPDGGKLKIGAAVGDDGFVCIKVEDTGCGIPVADIPHVFEPFFTTKEPGEGTGLGLSVSHSIIEKHKGRIDVSSEVGQGTVFSVCLPAAVGEV